MDLSQGWTKIVPATKTGMDKISNAADWAAPAFAPFAARWDEEANRRKALRTPENLRKLMDAQKAHTSARATAAQARTQRAAARKASGNPLAGARRAARTADKAARAHQRKAKLALREARRSYPATLTRVAVQAHAVHSVPAAVASYVLSTPVDWTVWPAGSSLALIASHVLALALGRRAVSTAPVDGDLTAEERQLLERLDPSWWVQHAEERGLGGTVTTPAEVTAGGIVCDVRLDGQWTVGKLRSAEESVRALLGCRTDLRMEVGKGSRGGWAMLTLRTRSAADGDDLRWSPASTSFGVDTVTGDLVDVPLGERLLIAGRSGAGKSVASRPLLWAASEAVDTALVILDLKQVEGRLWDHRARVASTPAEVVDVVRELVAEMTERLAVLPKGQATWKPSPARPRITVVVDEGAEVVTAAKEALEGLESLARMGRAACVDLWWMTQKPTIGDGIPKQIAPQMSTRICLAVSTPAEARVVLGEDAQAKGWNADVLPAPGVAFVRDGKRKPSPVAVRYMTDGQVIGLPDRPVWHRAAVAPAMPQQTATAPTLTLVKTAPEAVETNRGRVLAAIRAGAVTAREVVDATGLNKGTVSREIKALTTAGDVQRHADGTLSVTTQAGEVSA